MLQKDTVDQRTLALIKDLQSKDYLKDFLLVGGTGLALQIGHRKSVDIDLFVDRDFDDASILQKLEEDFEFQLDFQDNNTLKGTIDDIKVDILSHKYTYINPAVVEEDIKLASVEDIAAMKLNAISRDGTRVKDFIDVYFLLKDYYVSELLEFFETKYKLRNSMHVLKSLNYFDDVSLDDWPVMIKEKDLAWEKVKETVDCSVNGYIDILMKSEQELNSAPKQNTSDKDQQLGI